MKSKPNLKGIYYRVSQFSIVVVFLITFFLSYFYFEKDGYWYFFFMSMAAEMVILLFATFFIERVIDEYKKDKEEKKWLYAKEYAHSDIQNLARALAITIFIAVNIDFKDALSGDNNENSNINNLLSKLKNDKSAAIIKEKILPQAQELSLALNRDKSDLESTIMLYKDVVPPYILHSLWLVRSQLGRFASTLIEGNSSLLEAQQSGGLKDEESIKLHTMVITSCETSLHLYLYRLEELLKKLT